MKEEKDSKEAKGWNDLLFNTIEKIAQAPGKIKDSKEPVSAAMDVFKSIREEVQSKMVKEFSDRVGQLDFDGLSKKAAEHIANHFDVEIKISLKPKKNKKPDEQEP